MMRFLFCVLLLVFISNFSYAQKEANIWYFGQYAGLDFNSGAPIPLSNGKLNTAEGCASIADKTTGQLLFYTDGTSVWDRNHNVMPNGTGLLGNFSSSQAAIIVPMPGSSTKFYIFTTDSQAGDMSTSTTGYGGLAYSIVDMTLNGGNGAVTVLNQKLISPTTEKLCAVRHCNGTDYWVMVHEWNSNAFYAYRVSASGVQPPVITYAGITHTNTGSARNTETLGYMKFSPDGKKLAVACYYVNILQIFDFDNATGVVSNPITDNSLYPYSNGNRLYGVSFSPDNSKLYVSQGAVIFFHTGYVFQYDMNAGNASAILASRTLLSSQQGISVAAIQIGPDGKVYVAKESYAGGLGYLDVINNPNAAGTACNYIEDALDINPTGNNLSRAGLPGMVESFLIPPITATLTYPSGCTGTGTLVFKDSTINGNLKYLWNFGDPASGANNTSTIKNPSHTFSSSGTYTIKFYISNDCRTDSFSNTITVTQGSLTISAGPDISICSGNSAPISLTGVPPGSIIAWSPSSGLSCNSCSSIIANPSGSTTYYISVTDPNGCKAKDTISVNIVSAVVATASPVNSSFCNGGTVQLQATGGSIYNWLPAAGLNNPTIANPVASPSVSTTYTVTVSAPGGCGSSTATAAVTVTPLPTISAGPDITICTGSNANLNATGTDIISYAWTPSAGLNCTDCANPIASPSHTTSYTVTVNAGTPCPAVDEIVVTVNSQIVASATPDTAVICTGETVQLMASGGSSYQWMPSSGLSNSSIANPVASPTASVTYTVTVSVSGGGCGSSTAAVPITVYPVSTINAGADVSFCSGSNVQLNAIGVNVNTYSWSPAAGLSCTDCPNPLANPGVTTTYTITVNAGGLCSAQDEVIVTVTDQLQAQVSPAADLCEGRGVQLIAGGGTNYVWSPATGLSNPSIANPVASPAVSTTYTVSVSSPGSGCASVNLTVTVTIRPLPVVDAGEDVTIEASSSVQLNVTGTGTNYVWTPAVGLDNIHLKDPTASPMITTTYTVYAYNQYGCSDTDHVIVNVEAGPYILFPNAFSPNHDGINDVFLPHYKDIKSIDLKIFNRWGELVFETRYLNIGWDGKFNGQDEGVGAYAFYATAVTDLDKIIFTKGNVTLMK